MDRTYNTCVLEYLLYKTADLIFGCGTLDILYPVSLDTPASISVLHEFSENFRKSALTPF